MIPRDYITEWRRQAPWIQDAQVEQDLIISRCLVEIFNAPFVCDRLAFRGGTALYKLHVRPPARYSEDIDLVQVTPEPIGDTIDLLRSTLDPWLGEPKRQISEGRINLVYRVESEDQPSLPLRVKLEINSREHFSELGYIQEHYEVNSRWFRGAANITTYSVEELLGTKLRALYQRKKGRDLFDIWYTLGHLQVNNADVIKCFLRYLKESGRQIARADFERNLNEKLHDARFTADMTPLLRPRLDWDKNLAGALVRERLIAILPGAPWKGPGQAQA